MKHLFGMIVALCATAAEAGDVAYPSGTVTRTYRGGVDGTIAGLPVSAPVEAEITATPQTFAAPSGNVFVVRGRFIQPPAYKDAADMTNWSNLIAVNTSGDYVRTSAAWGDGSGAVVASWPADWSTVTVEARGDVLGIQCAVSRSTLAMVSITTNRPAAATNHTPEQALTGDDIPASAIRVIGKHAMSPAKATVTRRLHSVADMGGNCRLSYDPLGWPTTSTKGKTCDAGVCIAWPENGEIVGGILTNAIGGWFDHKKVGQSVKTMENIFGGYVDGRQPPRGAQVWFWLISYDGKQRTNIKAGWNWRGE